MPVESLNLHDKKDQDGFKATPDEMKMISEKMKDPEFMKMFAEYATSLQDPAYRKEEEEYLKQVEQEAKEGGDDSFDFVFPAANFCVELLQKDKVCKNKKIFLNVCTSDKIDVYEERTTNDKNGSHWHVPVSVGPSREEEEGGKKVEVFDACFHPATVAIADRSDKFMVFLLEIAVENLNAGYSRDIGFEFKRMASSTPSIGQPKNQTIKRKAGESAFPKDEGGVSLGPIRAKSSHQTSGSSGSNAKSSNNKVSPPSATRPTAASMAAAVAKKEPLDAALTQPKDNVPKSSVAHRGIVDLTDAWNWKSSDKRIGVPKELVVKMEFTGVSTAKVLDINVEPTYISIEKSEDHPYFGEISLPFTVEATPGSAKFEKNKGNLTLVLIVVPPPKPAESQMEKEAAEQVVELDEETVKEECSSPIESSPGASPEKTSSSPSIEKTKHQDPVVVSAPKTAEMADVEVKKAESSAVVPTPATKKPKPSNDIFSADDALKELDDLEDDIRSRNQRSSSGPVPTVHRVPASRETGKKKEGDAPSSPNAKEATTDSGRDSSSGATKSGPSPPRFDHVGDNDRAAQVRVVLEKARIAREEAERSEKKESPSAAAAAAATAQEKKKSDSETATIETGADENSKVEAAPVAVLEASSNDNKKMDEPEMVDLRHKQDAWLEGVKQTEHEEELRKQLEEEEAEMKRMVEKAQKEQEEERDAKRKAKEQAKILLAEKEAERMAARLADKRKELPLNCHHIFALN